MLAQETLNILQAGQYVSATGKTVLIAPAIKAAVAGSCLYRPADFPDPVMGCAEPHGIGLTHAVTGETTLEAAHRLVSADPADDVLVLNFASAKNPGGGFLSGSQAQEESLARSSALYPCQTQMAEMYEFNRQVGTCLYSDHMIYSPRVPVFREDGGTLLEVPYSFSIVTAPAVNAGAVRKNEIHNVPHIRSVLLVRLQKALWLAARHGHKTLVLGAWGCGVFGNDPAEVAGLFAETLGPGGSFHRCFEHVTYAVYDRTPGQDVLIAFQTVLNI